MQDPRKSHKKRVAQSVKEETQFFASPQDSSLTIPRTAHEKLMVRAEWSRCHNVIRAV